MLFLLGFMGIALDIGRLFIVKTELQTAMDSCALAAAQELDGQSTALSRATSAGKTAGNLNKVNLQSSTWSGQGQITDAEITFKDASYVATSVPATAKYAQCQHTQSGIGMWLLQSMGAFSGSTADYPSTQSVMALAVATRSNAQTTCPIPVAFKPKAGGTAPNYGLSIGEWVPLIMAQNAATGGQIGWANLDGSSSASETEAEMISSCGTKVGDTLGTPGVQTSIADAWNYRFGIYKNAGDPAVNHPDFTGYAYTATNWPSQKSAYDGAYSSGTAQNFLTKRQAFASCADTGTKVKGANSCESITGLTLNSFQKLAAPGITTGGHRQYGTSRRLVLVPVINAAAKVVDYACMLMLQPLSIPMTTTQLEYRGNAGDPASPCTTSGLPGSTAGPLVPVLVR
jgi:Flp pilus assembly protein TadG